MLKHDELSKFGFKVVARAPQAESFKCSPKDSDGINHLLSLIGCKINSDMMFEHNSNLYAWHAIASNRICFSLKGREVSASINASVSQFVTLKLIKTWLKAVEDTLESCSKAFGHIYINHITLMAKDDDVIINFVAWRNKVAFIHMTFRKQTYLVSMMTFNAYLSGDKLALEFDIPIADPIKHIRQSSIQFLNMQAKSSIIKTMLKYVA
jgi:hypothetical protein